MIAIRAPRLFDGRNEHEEVVVLIEGERIVGFGAEPPPGVLVEDLAEDHILAPGYIDLQVNGGGGLMFDDRSDTATLAAVAAAHAAHGTTAILPTLISCGAAGMARGLQAVRDALAAGTPGILGLHLEGPFLAPARRGIHPLAGLASPQPADLARLCAPFPAPLLVTLAPEVVPPSAIRQLADAGVIVFAGHSDAGWAQVRAALDAGLRGFTHLYNAMSPLAVREPGMVGAALDDGRAFAGIIADGHHVHPAALRIALAALGPERLFLVSDAMATAGSDIAGFTLAGTAIHLDNGRLADAAGTLAGAHLTMAEAVRNFVTLAQVDWTVALRMATATPAECLGLADRGIIASGARADLVVLDDDLNVVDVWQGGQRL